jgi:hypothetical protein
VAIGDLNGDGALDIAVADGDIATIIVSEARQASKFSIPIPVGR